METTIRLSKDNIRAKMGEYYGDITNDLDKHLRSERRRNYIMRHPHSLGGLTTYAFRVLGATRGCIIVDKNSIIQEFRVYEDTGDCYDEKVSEVCDKYIGRKLIVEKLSDKEN